MLIPSLQHKRARARTVRPPDIDHKNNHPAPLHPTQKYRPDISYRYQPTRRPERLNTWLPVEQAKLYSYMLHAGSHGHVRVRPAFVALWCGRLQGEGRSRPLDRLRDWRKHVYMYMVKTLQGLSRKGLTPPHLLATKSRIGCSTPRFGIQIAKMNTLQDIVHQ